MKWRKIIHRTPYDVPVSIGLFVLIPVVLCVSASWILSAVPWFRPAEANAAMQITPSSIDGQRAYEYLKQICKIGPRTAGSEANTKQRELVKNHFQRNGAEIKEQKFRAVHPVTGEQLAMVNLIGSWNPDKLRRVVIGAHYDTRPHADQEDDPARQQLPFLGANDCASGVALLMEISNHLSTLNTPWGVDLVLFDGEELVFGNDPGVGGEYFLGSEEFARIYAEKRDRRGGKMRYVAGMVLDMVGGRNAQIKQDPTSQRNAPAVVQEVWKVARALKVKSFSTRTGREVRDDHISLLKVGIPAIDLIDFDYPYWHKADDLPENCSAESLADVGRVIITWLSLPDRRIGR